MQPLSLEKGEDSEESFIKDFLPMTLTIDIFFVLLSLCAVLLCAIFIAVIVLLRKQ